jgi:apolipoprotein D and lipocalin family protein
MSKAVSNIRCQNRSDSKRSASKRSFRSWSGALLLAMSPLLLISCRGVPEGLQVVEGFELDRYLGRWYEIARLDHRFERGLEQVTATYTLEEKGKVKVLNRGWKTEEAEWSTAEGKAYLDGSPEQGKLKVSFFGPFYAAYNIIALDPEYQWAVVTGPDRGYLWILSRSPIMDEALKSEWIARLKRMKFAVDDLIWVRHKPQDSDATTP